MLAELARPLHLRTPDNHALALHPTGRGRVTIARRLGADSWHEASVPVPDLSYVTRQLQGETDVYLTQNRFFSRRRLVAHLAELDAFFTDLDYYRTPLADADPRHVLDLALETLALHRMPEPTFALATGRGLALIWLHSPVPRAALPRWRACQKAIHDALRHLGADRLATDAARVLRLVGTRNSRSGSLVEAITPVGEVWNFDMLADEILPIPRAELVALRLERAARRARGKGVPRPSCYFTATSLWELRLAELQQLREHRWLGSLPSGQRDLWLLLAAAAISYLVPAQMVRREVYALADQVTGGAWSEREAAARMSAVIARAERAAYGHKIEYGGRLIDPRYRFKTETIIELLAITETEMRACGFRHLASSEIQRELERQRWHERRTAAGGLSRAEYLENSLTQRKPWENEGISRRTYYRRQGGTGPSGCMVGMPSEGTSPVCRG